MKTRTIQAFALGALMSLLTMAPQASAAVSLVIGEDNEGFYNNFENLFDSEGQFKAPTVAGLEVGDHLAGLINVQNIDVLGGTHWFSSGTDQLTGLFAQRIEDIVDVPGPEVLLIFGPAQVNTFCNGADCISTVGKLAGEEIFALYTQSGPGTTTFNSGGTLASSFATATDGDLWVTLGYAPGLDGVYGTPDDTGYNYGFPVSDPFGQPFGEAFGGLNIYQNNTGYPFAKVNDPGEFLFNKDVDVYFTSEFEPNTNASSPWLTRSNDPFVVHPIPEPGSLALLSMGLMGLGVVRTRRRS
jgi:hypothetical protein